MRLYFNTRLIMILCSHCKSRHGSNFCAVTEPHGHDLSFVGFCSGVHENSCMKIHM